MHFNRMVSRYVPHMSKGGSLRLCAFPSDCVIGVFSGLFARVLIYYTVQHGGSDVYSCGPVQPLKVQLVPSLVMRRALIQRYLLPILP